MSELTALERETAVLVSEGLTNRGIAARLYVTHGTVRNRVTICLSKLHLTNRAQLTAWVLKGGLEQPTPVPAYNPDVYKDLLFGVYA